MKINVEPLQAAVRKISEKTPIGSVLRSKEWEGVPLALRERAFFSAAVTSSELLTTMQGKIEARTRLLSEQVAQGERVVSRSAFVRSMREELMQSGYLPEPGKEGTLQDLRTRGRLGLIYDIQTQSAAGYANWMAGQDAGALLAYPAQELYRAESRRVPRQWVARWTAAGGTVQPDGRMIALKSDPIWMAINRFEVPWPPFDFGSGMRVRDIGRAEAIALGLMASDAVPEPAAIGYNDKLQASVRGLDDEMRSALEQVTRGQVDVTGDIAKWGAQMHDPYLATDFRWASTAHQAELRSAALTIAERHTIPAVKLLDVGRWTSKEGLYAEYFWGKGTIEIEPNAVLPGLAFVHEHGHYVDDLLAGFTGKPFSKTPAAWPVHRAIIDSRGFKRLARKLKNPTAEALQPTERWARAYTQWIIQGSKNEKLLEDLLMATDRLGLWRPDDFRPIAYELDALFRLRGLMR